MKYDDAAWHYGGNFPSNLPPEAGATHTGLFLAWALLSGLAGDIHLNEFREGFEKLRARSLTPGRFFLEMCDGKFADDDLNEEGNAFAQAYFDFDHGLYLSDYDHVLSRGLPSQYHVADTWENHEKLRPTLEKRLEEWRRNS